MYFPSFLCIYYIPRKYFICKQTRCHFLIFNCKIKGHNNSTCTVLFAIYPSSPLVLYVSYTYRETSYFISFSLFTRLEILCGQQPGIDSLAVPRMHYRASLSQTGSSVLRKDPGLSFMRPRFTIPIACFRRYSIGILLHWTI